MYETVFYYEREMQQRESILGYLVIVWLVNWCRLNSANSSHMSSTGKAVVNFYIIYFVVIVVWRLLNTYGYTKWISDAFG